MKNLQRIFDFYIFSSIHVALGVFCFVQITLFSYDLEENKTALFCFFATIVSYNFIRFLNVVQDKNCSVKWYVNNNPLISTLTFISGVIVMYLSFSFRFEALMVLSPFFVLTFFYGIKLPRKLISLRRVPGLKIFLIAFCFAGVTVLFPLAQNNVTIGANEWWYILQRLFFVILITLPFDIRDVDFDSSQLKTIPQQIGVFNTKIVGAILAGGVLFIEFYFLNSLNIIIRSVLIICALSFFLLMFSTKRQSNYYSSFWVESIPILWFLLLLGLNL